MGVVFRAFDPELERTVAVKILSPELRLSEEFRTRFSHESKVLAQLSHPGIVAIHEAGRKGELLFLVMDLVDGLSLANVLKELERKRPRRLTGPDVADVLARPTPAGRDSLIDPDSYFRTAARIVRDTARALEAAHGCGVLHHDLNPKNVMLSGGAQPMVLDFGLARSDRAPSQAKDRGLYGTLPYMAPEQFEGSSVGNDPRTDIYQLGLILYELLTLRRAFEPAEYEVLQSRIRRAEYPWPREASPEVPRDLEAICLKAIAADPAHRYGTTRALREDLERFLEGVPTRARPPGPLRRLAVAARRHRALTAALASLAVALVLGMLLARHYGKWPFEQPGGTFVCLNALTKTQLVLHDTDSVFDGDVIAFKVNTSRPAVYYAVTLSGPDVEHAAVMPMHLKFVDDLSSDDIPPWGLEAPRDGKRLLAVTQVNGKEISAGERRVEQPWILQSTERCVWLENWLDALERQVKMTGSVSIAEARKRLASLGTSGRGDPVAKVSEDDRRILREMGKHLDPKDDTPWPFDDPRLTHTTLFVQPGARK
jgi:hypothetical protein